MRFAKVTAVLATEMAGAAPYLDALCELVMASKIKTVQESSNGHRHDYEIRGRGQSVALDAPGKIPIPIIREMVNGVPIPHCSSPIVAVAESDSASHYTSAFPIGRGVMLASKERTKIQQTGGRYKSFRLPLRNRVIDRVVWFAALRVGNNGSSPMSQLRRLLKRVQHIGKKTSQGHGMVKEWIVEACEQDWSWYAPGPLGTVLMRPLLATMDHPSDLAGYRRAFGGVHGPYWQREFYREIVTPC